MKISIDLYYNHNVLNCTKTQKTHYSSVISGSALLKLTLIYTMSSLSITANESHVQFALFLFHLSVTDLNNFKMFIFIQY